VVLAGGTAVNRMLKNQTAKGFALILIAIALVTACSSDNKFTADPKNAAQVALGEKIYNQQCANCHGKQLEGQPNWRKRADNGKLPAPPHDDTGHTWHHPDQTLFEIAKYGMAPPHAPEGYQSDMPAYEKRLTDEEIWAVLAYIKSRWSTESRRVQSEIDKKSKK
jgi:mono/diheme cytochrome c family protein